MHIIIKPPLIQLYSKEHLEDIIFLMLFHKIDCRPLVDKNLGTPILQLQTPIWDCNQKIKVHFRINALGGFFNIKI